MPADGGVGDVYAAAEGGEIFSCGSEGDRLAFTKEIGVAAGKVLA